MYHKERIHMRKKDLLLMSVILVLALAAWAVYQFVLPGSDSTELQITVDGAVYGVYDLREDQTIKINDTNTCVIEGGRVSMVSSKCPDHLCEKQKSIDSRGGTIVCLPNKVVLSIVSDGQPEYDAVT